MQSEATTADGYIKDLQAERRPPIIKLRNEILKNLPEGFREEMSYGMIGYVIPHSLYPQGYHCNPRLPLPFMAFASQKNFIAVYHMGMYASKTLFDWFTKEYIKQFSVKPDMGKSCIRFKKPELIPFDLIGKLSGKITPQEWITMYEKQIKK